MRRVENEVTNAILTARPVEPTAWSDVAAAVLESSDSATDGDGLIHVLLLCKHK